MTGVFDFDDTPWVLPGSYLLTADFQDFFGANDGEGHQTTQLCVLFNGVLVVFLNIVREVVDRDTVMFNILHNQFFGLCKLCGSERVCLADDGDDVDTGREALHQFDIEFSETVAGRGDKVEEGVDSVVPESGVTLNSGLHGKNIVILAFEVSNNL